jgi:hypothetical protein
MVAPEQDEQPWRKKLPEWWSRTPPEFRAVRLENPHLAMWAEMEDNDVLEKQHRDLREDAEGSTDPGREKSALTADVARLQQNRAKGQTFRTDQRPGRISMTTELFHGDHDFLKSPESWNEARRKL